MTTWKATFGAVALVAGASNRAWRRGMLALLVLASSAASADVVTLTGADLYALRGSKVFFPTTPPVLDGTSLVFGPDGNSLKLMVVPLIDAGTYGPTDTVSIALRLSITRLVCSSCGVASYDFDPNFLISDGTHLVGALTADNDNGSALGASFVDAGTSGTSRDLSAPVFTDAGYPDIGTAFDVTLLFTIAPGVTTTEITYFGKTGNASVFTRALNPAAGLSFVFLRDLDAHIGGEQYQINSLTMPNAVPAPQTLALALLALAGLAAARRRKS